MGLGVFRPVAVFVAELVFLLLYFSGRAARLLASKQAGRKASKQANGPVSKHASKPASQRANKQASSAAGIGLGRAGRRPVESWRRV